MLSVFVREALILTPPLPAKLLRRFPVIVLDLSVESEQTTFCSTDTQLI